MVASTFELNLVCYLFDAVFILDSLLLKQRRPQSRSDVQLHATQPQYHWQTSHSHPHNESIDSNRSIMGSVVEGPPPQHGDVLERSCGVGGGGGGGGG